MKVHFLPEEQEKRNDKAIEKLSRIGYVLFGLLMATLALAAWLYLRPPASQVAPHLSSDDGQVSWSDAIVLAQDLVITPVRISGTAQFVTKGEHTNAQRIDGTTLPDGTYITLLRLDTPTSVDPVAVVVVDPGESLVATSSGQEWHGMARAQNGGLFPVDPDFNLNAGTAVYRDSDRQALVGFAVKTASGAAIVPAQEIVSRFPEVSSGR